MTDSLDHPPREIKPRHRRYKFHPVVAIAGEDTLSEDGELGSVKQLMRDLRQMDSTLFAKAGAADFIARLDAHYAEWDTDEWQWRATEKERAIVRPDGLKVAGRVTVVIHYFGWKNGTYHKIIDPVTMYGHRLDDIWPGEEGQLYRLLQWGVCLRDFCHKNRMEIRPTIGGISAQFLTDRRFYPKRRRKVPQAINDRAREQLPGNHYVLNVKPTPKREFTAQYLDQHRAHHYHARTVAFPDSNELYAYGRFADLSEIVWEEPFDHWFGLYCLDLQAPTHYRKSHWIKKLEHAFVFSNEIPHLLDLGYQINGVRAGWGSHLRDKGLTRYAKWADKQLNHYGDKRWLKPLLLATYGTLATRAGTGETVFRLARSGEDVTLVTGNKSLAGRLVCRPKKLEPRIANVIHRGMIEAATRSESVGLAQWLGHVGWRVLSIYADAVIVEDEGDKELPILPEPWRCKTTLNHLQFLNQQAFVSGEMTKLPGVGRERLNYRQSTSPGHAPRMEVFDALTGETTQTNRRI